MFINLRLREEEVNVLQTEYLTKSNIRNIIVNVRALVHAAINILPFFSPWGEFVVSEQ